MLKNTKNVHVHVFFSETSKLIGSKNFKTSSLVAVFIILEVVVCSVTVAWQ